MPPAATKTAPPKRTARSTSRKAGEVTRERMLDAAEELFAMHGYHGTSLRDVAREVEAPIALVTYHFESKDNLFDRVVERRASIMGMNRLRALDEARAAAGDGIVPVEQLIEGYVWPFIERSTHGGPGWKNYSQLVARLANSSSWTPVISKHYDAVARQYIAEFRRTLPRAGEAGIYHAFSFMVGTMVATVAEPGRVEKLSHGKQDASNLEEVFKVMVPFLAAGFATIERR